MKTWVQLICDLFDLYKGFLGTQLRESIVIEDAIKDLAEAPVGICFCAIHGIFVEFLIKVLRDNECVVVQVDIIDNE